MYQNPSKTTVLLAYFMLVTLNNIGTLMLLAVKIKYEVYLLWSTM